MLGPHFYNEAIRKTVIGFGTLFNNIEIRKKDPSTGTVIEAESNDVILPIGVTSITLLHPLSYLFV